MNFDISRLIPAFKESSLPPSSSEVKGKWVYTDKKVFYSTDQESESHKGKKIEISLQKIKNFLQKIDPLSLKEEDIQSLSKLKTLVDTKVEKYNQSHGVVYKFFSKLIYGDVNSYKNQIVNCVDTLVKNTSSKKEECPLVSDPSQQGENSTVNSFYREPVAEFVKNFLLPYITGQIHAGNEPKDQAPMIEQLMSELEAKKQEALTPIEKQEIKKLALENFLQVSIGGLYAHLKRNHALSPIEIYKEEKFSPEFQLLLSGLKPALIKHFSNQNLSDQQLVEMAKKALLKFNQDVGDQHNTGKEDDRHIEATDFVGNLNKEEQENKIKLRELAALYARKEAEVAIIDSQVQQVKKIYDNAQQEHNSGKINTHLAETNNLYSEFLDNETKSLNELLEIRKQIKEKTDEIASKKLFLDPKQTQEEIKEIAATELAKAKAYKTKRIEQNEQS